MPLTALLSNTHMMRCECRSRSLPRNAREREREREGEETLGWKLMGPRHPRRQGLTKVPTAGSALASSGSQPVRARCVVPFCAAFPVLDGQKTRHTRLADTRDAAFWRLLAQLSCFWLRNVSYPDSEEPQNAWHQRSLAGRGICLPIPRKKYRACSWVSVERIATV